MPDFRARGEAPGSVSGNQYMLGGRHGSGSVNPRHRASPLAGSCPSHPCQGLQTRTWGPLDLRRMCFLLSAFFFFFSGQALSAREDSCCHPQPCPRQPWPRSPRRSALSQLLICHHRVTLCGLITSPNHSLTLTSLERLPGFLSLTWFCDWMNHLMSLS